MNDRWHYARPELAKHYLNAFDLGLASARGLFARRRMGKTEFLVKDLLPLAREEGYLTAYANLWDNRTDPAAALIVALGQAVERHGLAKLLESVRRPIKSLKATGKIPGGVEATVQADLADPQKRLLDTLGELLTEVDQRAKRLLLVIDEAQILGSAASADFAYALRAALDTRKHNIKVIFAGSSEATLRRMFGRSSEPFYNWAALEPFQLLDRDFVEDMVEKVNAISRFPLDVLDALQAFDELKRTPEFFRRYLERYVTHPQDGHAGALAYTKKHVFNDSNFIQQWQTFLPADQAILQLLAQGVPDLHGKAARLRLGQALGLEKEASMSTAQHALRRLQADNVVMRMSHGEYRFEDEAFAEWIKQMADDGV